MYNNKPKPLPSLTNSDISRFWSKVAITADDELCWIWNGGYRGEYGKISINHSNHVSATRISFFINKGVDPSELLVCHTCDNPACVNPNHLFLGNYRDNAIDMFNKGRCNVPKGERHRWSKLTAISVKEIKEKYRLGINQYKLAEEYGVHQCEISRIVNNKRYKSVTN